MEKKDSLCGRVMDGAKVVVRTGLELIAGSVIVLGVSTLPIWMPLALDAIYGVPSQTSEAPLKKPYQYENKGYHSPADFPPTGPAKDFGSFGYYPPNCGSGNDGRE